MRDTLTNSEDIHTYGYDDVYRVETAAHPDFPDESFTYDAVGNRLTKNASPDWLYNDANQLLDDGAYTYRYDDLYRLETAAHPDFADEGYTYDEVGNRLTSTERRDAINRVSTRFDTNAINRQPDRQAGMGRDRGCLNEDFKKCAMDVCLNKNPFFPPVEKV